MDRKLVVTILLVEDEAIIALDISRTLEDFGYAVVTASNGEKALSLISSFNETGRSVDLVLMDIDLGPGIDGTETARRILSMIDVPIVFHTSHAEKEMVDKVKGITRYGYVLKSAGRFVLSETISMAFELYRTRMEIQRHSLQTEDAYRHVLESEGQLERMNGILLSLRKVGQIITDETDPVRLLDQICNLLTEGNGYNSAWIVRLEAGRPRQPYSHAGIGRKFAGMVKLLDSGALPECARKTLERREIVITDGPEIVCAECMLSSFYPDSSGIAVPIIFHDRQWGVLVVNAPRVYANSGSERHLLYEISSDIGMALETLEHAAANRRQEENRCRSELLLNATERLTGAGGWMWDVTTGTMDWTEETYRIHGLDPEDRTGATAELIRKSLDCYDESDRAILMGAFQRCIDTGEPYDLQFPFTDYAGNRKWVRTAAHRKTAGESIRIVGNIVDSTETHERESRYRQLEDGMKEGIAVYEAINDGEDFTIADMNRAGLEMGKVTLPEIVGKRLTTVHPYVVKMGLLEVLRQVYRDGEPRVFPLTEYTDDRIRLLVENYVFRLPSGFVVAVYENTLKQREAEDALRESEEFARTVGESVPLLLYVYDLEQKRNVWVNENHARFFRAVSSGNPAGFTEMDLEKVIHPDDWPELLRLNEQFLIDDFAGTYGTEVRMRQPDGWVWMFHRVAAFRRNEAGRVTRIIGSLMDISEQKNIEIQLADANSTLERMVAERDVLLKEVHHRIKNDMNAISSLLALQAAHSGSEEVRDVLWMRHEAASR